MSVRDLIPWGRNSVPGVRSEEAVNPFLALHRDMNRLFDDFFRGVEPRLPLMMTGRVGGWPYSDVTETGKEYRVTAELPGMEEKDIEVLVHGDTLILKGEKKHEEGGGDAVFSERYHGRFQRTITFDTDIDPAKVTAEFKNGVLTVLLPKTETEEAKATRVRIETK